MERRLRDIREPVPSPALRVRLEQGIPDSFRQREPWFSPERMWVMAKVGAVAAMVVGLVGWATVALFLGPGGANAAFAATLEPIARATGDVAAVHVVFERLIREGEDFGYVNLDGDMQRVEAWIRWPRDPGDAGRARTEKRDRVYCFDGKETVFYHPLRREAFRQPGGYVDLETYWPGSWVSRILANPGPDVQVLEHSEADGKGRLLFRQGAVDLNGRKPSFVDEFERETELEWDLATHRLTGLRLWVIVGGDRRLFSRLASIEYLPDLDDSKFRLDLPADVRWGGPQEAPPEIVALGPRDVATRIFWAARTADRAALEMFVPAPSTVDWLMSLPEARTMTLEKLGSPFKSGNYPGVFVPYRLRFADGSTKGGNLALRTDLNPQNRWLFDGGI